MGESRLIVGLGNPGRDYEYTRHNLGFLTVQRLAEKIKFKFSLSSLTNGLAAEGNVKGTKVYLLMPMTYMNNSGAAVYQVMSKKELSPEQLLVISDDFNLDFERIRVRGKGSDGGHNGLKSIIQRLGTDQFARLRMGIGRPAGKKNVTDYVLEEFKKNEKKKLDGFINESVFCCETWLNKGIDVAMDQFNTKS